ncbi:APC family permease [Gluconacetobacter sp. Hr-1-5]|uniref:APC family permease n=1 Tax=Gluconacetobacter sp. Hr-1-5 TaxID=3395370 RepID=UPI003B51A4ED
MRSRMNTPDSDLTSDSGAAGALQRTISPFQFLVFGFGSIVGTAWVVLLGVWLSQAGPGGAMVGIAFGGGAMALIAAMYAELASRFPQTGGEVTYINAVFGKTPAFAVGWLLTLAYLSALVFEGVALAWLAEIIWPRINHPVLYSVLGEPIGLGGLLLALASCVIIAVANYKGACAFVKFQNVLTAAFLLVVFVAVVVELGFGSGANIQPLWQAADGGSWLIGAAWVFGCAPMMFNSFQSVLHTIEERSQATSKDVVVRLCVVAVLAVMLFYLAIVLAAARAAPWQSLASSDLPAVAALAHLPWVGALTNALLLALIASLLKAWNSVFMTTVRLLFAQARDGMIPAVFGSVNPVTGAPDKAVIIVAGFNIAGLFLGKGILEPIVNTTSLCIALIYALTCAATLAVRRRDPHGAGFRVPGGYPVGILAIAAALGMAAFALLLPAHAHQADTFKWILLLSWTLLGLGLYRMRNRGPRITPPTSGRLGIGP